MQKLTRGLVPLIGIALILAGVYLIFKPKIDAYLTNKENEEKIEVYEESQQNAPSKVPEIPKDPSKVVGVLEVPSVGIKEAVYPGLRHLNNWSAVSVWRKRMNHSKTKISLLRDIRIIV